ncbi:hypothetical protein HpCOL17_00560 [Helicobacter pylori]
MSMKDFKQPFIGLEHAKIKQPNPNKPPNKQNNESIMKLNKKARLKKHFPIPAPTYIPTLEKSSIISDEELDFQVRNG